MGNTKNPQKSNPHNKFAPEGQKQERKESKMTDYLHNVSTKDLVEELQKRDGVETTIAAPYQDKTVSVNGPAIVLVVID